MNILLKKIAAIVLIIGMSVNVFFPINVYAYEVERKSIVKDILEDYHIRCTRAVAKKDYKTVENIQNNTIEALKDEGTIAYSITPHNYYELEKELNTNFEDMMIEPNSYYIIVQEGENQDNLVSPNKSAGSSFSYTLNGKKYTMRYLTVTAADNSSYGQASIVNLMKSKTKSVIKFIATSHMLACGM